MKFKEYVAKDLATAFFNLDEHAEQVSINGVTVTVVQDNERLMYKTKNTFQGLVVGDILFFISEAEYAKITGLKHPPRADDVMLYNGKPCTIIDVVSNLGVYEITLQFNGNMR